MARTYIDPPAEQDPADEYDPAAPRHDGWFDLAKADNYPGDTEYDAQSGDLVDTNVGRNRTQTMYRTAQGRWVLGTFSSYVGERDRYVGVDPDIAREWLIFNGHDSAVAEHFGLIPEERGPGRPEIGGRVNLRLGDGLLTAVDRFASDRGFSRADAIRRLVLTGLGTEREDERAAKDAEVVR
jgi:hypothetical protein